MTETNEEQRVGNDVAYLVQTSPSERDDVRRERARAAVNVLDMLDRLRTALAKAEAERDAMRAAFPVQPDEATAADCVTAIENLWAGSAALTASLAERDAVIGELVKEAAGVLARTNGGVFVALPSIEACTHCEATFTEAEQAEFDPDDNDHCPGCQQHGTLTTYYGEPEYRIQEYQIDLPATEVDLRPLAATLALAAPHAARGAAVIREAEERGAAWMSAHIAWESHGKGAPAVDFIDRTSATQVCNRARLAAEGKEVGQ